MVAFNFDFQIFLFGFQVGSKFGYKFGIFGKCLTMIFSNRFWLSFMYSTSFNVQNIWVHSE